LFEIEVTTKISLKVIGFWLNFKQNFVNC